MQQDLTAFIKKHSKQILGTKFWDVRLICKVDAGFKQDKLEHRYLVISKFRIFFLSAKNAQKCQVESNFHILAVTAIEVVSAKEVRLTLEESRKIYVNVHDLAAVHVAENLLRAFKHYFPNCNDSLKLFLHLVPGSLYMDYIGFASSKPTLPCENFRRSYASLCDYYKLPFRDEVVWDIEKIYACHENRCLRVEDFNHLMQRDLVPIIGVMQFSQWFTSLVIENIKVTGDLLDVICLVLKRSQWLSSLTLNNCSLKSEMISTLHSCLSANPSLPLECLDLRGNSFEEHKPFVALGTALPQLNTRLRELRLDDCSLNFKAVNAIAGGLFRSQLNAPCLKVISLASNPLKDDISELCTLLSHCTSLEELDLSNTHLSLEKLWGALKIGGLQLRVLKLSGCSYWSRKMSKQTTTIPAALKQYFASAMALKTLDLSNCTLQPEVIKSVLLGVACNQDLCDLSVDLSRSCSDSSTAAVLETALPACNAVTALSLRDNGLYECLTSLLPAIGRMKNLRCLDIGGSNMQSPRKHHGQMLPNILIELVKIISDEESSIRDLILSDGNLGVNMSVVFNALGVAPHLCTLDVSGNSVGNFGARLLAKALQINTSLHTVHIDRNQITADGYADIVNALNDNKKVSYIPYPVQDAIEATSKGEKDKTLAILNKLGDLLSRNRSNQKVLTTDAEKRAHKARHLDEELNKQLYDCQKLTDDVDSDQNNQEFVKLRQLIDDAESAKKLCQSEAKPRLSQDAVDQIVKSFENVARPIFEAELKKSVHDAVERRKELNFVEIMPGVKEQLVDEEEKINCTFESIVSSLSLGIQDLFSDMYDMSMHSMYETLSSTMIAELKQSAAHLSRLQVASQNSASSITPNSPRTPKQSKKGSFHFGRGKGGRPKSTVDAEALDAALKDHQDHEDFEEAGDSSLEGSCSGWKLTLSDRSMDVHDTVESQPETTTEKLVCPGRDRPRGPQRRRPQARMPSVAIQTDKHAFKVDQFLHATQDVSNKEQASQEETAQIEEKEGKVELESVLEEVAPALPKISVNHPKTQQQPKLFQEELMNKLKKQSIPNDKVDSSALGSAAPPNTPATPIPVNDDNNEQAKAEAVKPNIESVENPEYDTVAGVSDKAVDKKVASETTEPALSSDGDKKAPPRPPMYKTKLVKIGSADENGNTSSEQTSAAPRHKVPLKPPTLPPKPNKLSDEEGSNGIKMRAGSHGVNRPLTSIYPVKGDGDKREERKSVMDMIGMYDLQKPVPPPRARNLNKVSPSEDS